MMSSGYWKHPHPFMSNERGEKGGGVGWIQRHAKYLGNIKKQRVLPAGNARASLEAKHFTTVANTA